MFNKIVMIDDNTTDLFITRTILEFCNYDGDIIEFDSSVDGLKYLNSNSDFDLLFLDINMPYIDAYELLKQYNGNVPIAILTSSNIQSESEIIEDQRIISFITKPFTKNDFFKLKKYLV